jgi:two-component system chemotaxis response regulator CheY
MRSNVVRLIFIIFPSFFSDMLLASTSPRDVVLVEDNPVFAKMARLNLTEMGLEVHDAENGEKGITMARQLIAQSKPILVLTDINMPVMDGLKMVELIRADLILRGVPIICMSDKESADKAKKAGANAFLEKPFGTDSFKTCVRPFIVPAVQ